MVILAGKAKTSEEAKEMLLDAIHSGKALAKFKEFLANQGGDASIVDDLSEWMEVEVKRDGHIYEQRYERGNVCYELRTVGDCPADETGTKVTFLPDKEIFQETTVFEYDILKHRLREMAFLTKGIKIILTDLREGQEKEETFHYEGGIREFVYDKDHQSKIYIDDEYTGEDGKGSRQPARRAPCTLRHERVCGEACRGEAYRFARKVEETIRRRR